jgi:putative tricarboxylic transport membrane protein
MIYAACGAASCLLVAWPGAGHGQAWRPDKNVEIIAPATPGGLHDITARAIQQALQARKLVQANIVVVNKGGGGGTVGWTYLSQQQGDPHFLSLASVNLLANHIMGTSTLNYTDFTTIALLFHEYLGLAVRSDSTLASGKDMVERLSKNPASMSIAVGTSLGNTGHLALSLAVKGGGGDVRKLKTVVFGSNGEAMTALLGGHVDAMMTSLSNLVRHVQSKSVRVVAISSPQRVAGQFSAVPTWREQGVDVLMSGWRGVIAPRGLTPVQVAYWENVLARLGESEEWKQELEKHMWYGSQLTSRESREFFDKEYGVFQQLLGELGMARKVVTK